MLQLVYISTSRAPIDANMLESILAISRRKNAADEITGLLLAGGRRFLQALEGPQPMVMRTYNRIVADPRHFALVELSRREVDAREFGEWAMAYRQGGEADPDAAMREAVSSLTAQLPDPNVRALFTGFAELHTRGA